MHHKTQLIKDISRIKPIYTYPGKVFRGLVTLTHEERLTEDALWLMDIEMEIQKDFCRNLRFRGVPGNQLYHILATGVDIPGLGIGGSISAAPHIQKATEYGWHRDENRVTNCPLEKDLCIQIYDSEGLREGRLYCEYIFIRKPLDVLNGLLIFKKNPDFSS